MMLLLIFVIGLVSGEDVKETHHGVYIANLNTYHHGVSGSVFAVNSSTLYFKDFNYDGLGKDAYFWAGTHGNGPNPNGFIIPDQYGKKNVLTKAENKEFTLALPDHKLINDIKWISVFDLSKFENFGDVYIPDGFEAPSVQTLPPLICKTDDCSSDQIELVDTKTIKIYNLVIQSDNVLQFVVGKGLTPTLNAATHVIPDENGYFEPLRSYGNEDVELVLPGTLTFTDNSVHWLSVYDMTANVPLGYVTIPNHDESVSIVPPSLRKTIKYDYTLPNCVSLHRDFHVSWDVVGQTITFELVALANEDDWIGFGISGSNTTAQMIGADIAIAHINVRTGQGVVEDYNVDAKAPCSKILDVKKGVCKDSDLGKSDGFQVLEGRRVNGHLTVIKYRRQLQASDDLDKSFTDQPTSVVWALGRLMKTKEPGFHRLYPKHAKYIRFIKPAGLPDAQDGETVQSDACVPFLVPDYSKKTIPWGNGDVKIVDGKLRDFMAKLGPSAGLRGYEGITGFANPGYAWYIQGLLTPELYMQRGLTYTFKVEGGNNPHHVEHYHPFIITTDPIGGQYSLTNTDSRVLAGLEVTRRGAPRPTAAGRLCIWLHQKTDRRNDERFTSYEKFRNSLKLKCEPDNQPARLTITPNTSWPDVVYYHSYTQSNMGWKIHIVDNVNEVKSAGGRGVGGVAVVVVAAAVILWI